MTPTEFLQSVWSTDGLYCIATPAKEGYYQKVFPTIEDAAAYVEKIKDAKDVFFCVHSLKEEKIWNPNKGENGGWSIRLQKNMQESRTFFFDLDVGNDEKKYASQQDAIKGLKEFIAATKLPYPMVVSSGGGLHVYWRLDTSILSNEWRTYAERLKKLAKAHGLKADPARTTDTASVLRVAETYNHKRGEKRPVKVLRQGTITPLDDFLKLMNDATIRAGEKIIEPTAEPEVDPYFGEGNMDKKTYDKPHIKAVLTACHLMKAMNATRATHDQNQWYRTLGVVAFCEDGINVADKWSRPHPTYDQAHTATKIQQVLQFAPTKCETLASACGEHLCDGCAFKGKVPNPIVAARMIDSAPPPVIEVQVGPTVTEVQIPPPPKPYTRVKGGGISYKSVNKDGEEFHRTLYAYDLYPVRRVRNHALGVEQNVWRVTKPNDGETDFVLDAGSLYDRKTFVDTLANAGVYPHPDDIKELQNYMVAYIAELQRHSAAEAQATHLGWTEDHAAFILSDKIVRANGEIAPVTLSGAAATYAAPLHKKGTKERQIELLNFYNNPVYLPNQFAILAGLAAPIFGMTGHHGVIVNCTGEAGASKSSSVYAAASFWGDPDKFTINGTKDGATMRHRNAKTSTLANLPICVDEITTIGLDEAHNMAMGVSQAEGRKRLNPDGTPQKEIEGEKATIVLTTSNNSLHGLLSTNNSSGTAASMRVFEINFTRQIFHKKWEADDFLHDLKRNFGHLGEIYIQYVTQNYATVLKQVREEMKRIDQEANIQSGERFWSGVAAAIIVTGRIASQLGLIQFDMEALRHWVLTVQIPAMRGVVHEEYSSPIGVLTDYLEMVSGNTLVVQKLKASGIVNIIKKPTNQLLAHYDYEDKTMWVLRKGFKDYCVKIGANFLKIIDDLHVAKLDANGARQRVITNKNVKKVLGAGTEFGKAQAWCFIIDLKHPDCLGLPELEVVNNPSATVTPPKGKLKAVDEP